MGAAGTAAACVALVTLVVLVDFLAFVPLVVFFTLALLVAAGFAGFAAVGCAAKTNGVMTAAIAIASKLFFMVSILPAGFSVSARLTIS